MFFYSPSLQPAGDNEPPLTVIEPPLSVILFKWFEVHQPLFKMIWSSYLEWLATLWPTKPFVTDCGYGNHEIHGPTDQI